MPQTWTVCAITQLLYCVLYCTCTGLGLLCTLYVRSTLLLYCRYVQDLVSNTSLFPHFTIYESNLSSCDRIVGSANVASWTKELPLSRVVLDERQTTSSDSSYQSSYWQPVVMATFEQAACFLVIALKPISASLSLRRHWRQ
jgi:hypothetical protein